MGEKNVITGNDFVNCKYEWCKFRGEGTGMQIHLIKFHSLEKDKKRLEDRVHVLENRMEKLTKKHEIKMSELKRELEQLAKWIVKIEGAN